MVPFPQSSVRFNIHVERFLLEVRRCCLSETVVVEETARTEVPFLRDRTVNTAVSPPYVGETEEFTRVVDRTFERFLSVVRDVLSGEELSDYRRAIFVRTRGPNTQMACEPSLSIMIPGSETLEGYVTDVACARKTSRGDQLTTRDDRLTMLDSTSVITHAG